MGSSAQDAASTRRVRVTRAPTARRMTVASSAIAAVIILSIAGAGGTSAFLTSGASAAAGTTVVTSGTAGLTITPAALSMTALYPGLTLYGSVTATNTGDVPLSIGVSGLSAPTTGSNALSRALIIGLGAAASGDAASTAACAAGSVAPGWTGTFAAAVPGAIGSTLPVGASRVLCLSVALPLTAPTASQGQSADGFTVRIVGTQE